MVWLLLLSGYLLGSIPTAYIAGRLLVNRDIRRMGDGNVGAANAFRELGATAGIIVGLIDAAKGALAILIARSVGVSQPAILLTGVAAVVGHNWPVFLGFRGGRGESTTIGVLLTLIPKSMLIMAAPAVLTLVLTRNVVLTSTVLFVPLPFVLWRMGTPGVLVAYSIALACLVGLTHFFRTRPTALKQS